MATGVDREAKLSRSKSVASLRIRERILRVVFDSGSGHLALRVDNLDNTLRRLKREGILPRAAPVELRGPEWWRGARCVYVSDPDDVTVELVERSSRR